MRNSRWRPRRRGFFISLRAPFKRRTYPESPLYCCPSTCSIRWRSTPATASGYSSTSTYFTVEALTPLAVLWINLPGVWGVGLLSIYARSQLNSQTAKSHNTTKAAVRSTRFPVAVVPWQKPRRVGNRGGWTCSPLPANVSRRLASPVVRRKRRPSPRAGLQRPTCRRPSSRTPPLSLC
jgi:hypothetical protein